MEYTVNTQIETTVAARITDTLGAAVITLTTTDFDVRLLANNTAVYRKAEGLAATVTTVPVTIAHISDGFYSIKFTPTVAGLYRLTVKESVYGTDTPAYEFEVVSVPSVVSIGVDLATMKAYLGNGSAKYTDSDLTYALGFAEAAAKNYCDTVFAQATYTEYVNGSGFESLVVRHTPTSVTSVEQNGTAITDFELVDGIIYRMSASRCPLHWRKGTKNIKVVYTAGYTTYPSDLVLAICMIASDILTSPQYSGLLKGENIGNGEYSYTRGDSASILSPYTEILNKYRSL